MKAYKVYPIAILLCVVFFCLAFFGVSGSFWQGLKTSGDALTSDEVSHIPDGYYYLKTGRYFINPEHPPIIKDIAALPLLFFNPELPDISLEKEYGNDQWNFGRDFLYYSGNDPDRITFWSRFGIILFNTILLFLVFFFVKKLWKEKTALITTFFLAISPTFLAHGSLVTTDTIVSFFLILSAVTFALFLKYFKDKRIFWLYFGLSILFTAGAMLTKFSAFMMVAVLFIGGLLYLLISGKYKKKGWWQYILIFILFCVCQVILIGAFYAPHVVNMEPEGIAGQVEANYPDNLPQIGEDVMVWAANQNAFFQGIDEYLVGVLMVRGRVASAWQTIYFLGDVYGSEGAGLAYFPVLYFTKTTLAFLVLLVLSIFFGIFEIFRDKRITKYDFKAIARCPLANVLLVLIVVYLLVSLTSRLQIGLRHILPIMAAVYLLVAKKISDWWEMPIRKDSRVKWKPIFIGLLFLMFLASILTFPHYLSFYNILGGGTDNGYKIANDSNYDWMSQDLKRLANWVEENEVETLYTHLFTNVPPAYYLGDAYIPYNIYWDGIPEPGSYIVVSANELMNNIYEDNNPEDKKYTQILDYQIDRIGKTMFIFQIP